MKDGIEYSIIGEYRQDATYNQTYIDDFQEYYKNFNEFLSAIAKLVTVGAVKGADDTLGKIYQALLRQEALPIARRRPRRLKLSM